MDWWLKGGSFKKQSSMAAAESKEGTEPQASISSSQEFQGTECNVPDTKPLMCSSTVTGAGRTTSKNRKYCEYYVSSGFTCIGDVSAPDAQYYLCNKRLSNGFMFPAKLRRHHEMTRPECTSKDISFFKRKLQILTICQRQMTKNAETDNENATKASYRVIYHIALAGKTHIITETLIKPYAVKMAECMLDEQAKKKLETIQLSSHSRSIS
jgi:hypothetical protein